MTRLGGCGAGFCRARASAGVGGSVVPVAVGTTVSSSGKGVDLAGVGETTPGSGGLLNATVGGALGFGFAGRTDAFRFGGLAWMAKGR